MELGRKDRRGWELSKEKPGKEGSEVMCILQLMEYVLEIIFHCVFYKGMYMYVFRGNNVKATSYRAFTLS